MAASRKKPSKSTRTLARRPIAQAPLAELPKGSADRRALGRSHTVDALFPAPPPVAELPSGYATTLRELKERNIWIVGTDDQARDDLFTADFPDAVAWVLGAEGEGMRRLTRENCDLLVRIPMGGEVESLNVSVSAGICLYESVRRRGARGA